MGMMLAPLYCAVISLAHRPRKLFQYATTSMTVYTSVAVLAVTHGLKALFNRDAIQFVTTPKKASASKVRLYGWTFAFGILTLAIFSMSNGETIGFHAGM